MRSKQIGISFGKQVNISVNPGIAFRSAILFADSSAPYKVHPGLNSEYVRNAEPVPQPKSRTSARESNRALLSKYFINDLERGCGVAPFSRNIGCSLPPAW